MNRLLVPRPDERPSFQTTSDASSLILIVTICCLGLLVSLGAAIYGLDLGASLP
jgi:hypothetical protein